MKYHADVPGANLLPENAEAEQAEMFKRERDTYRELYLRTQSELNRVCAGLIEAEDGDIHQVLANYRKMRRSIKWRAARSQIEEAGTADEVEATG